jgi:hypothetical protein
VGIFLRKSFRLGPLRVNLSRRGLGASVGVTGARVGIDAGGRSYVAGGRRGIYFRRRGPRVVGGNGGGGGAEGADGATGLGRALVWVGVGVVAALAGLVLVVLFSRRVLG